MSKLGKQVTQRQLRVGEMVKQALSMMFLKEEAKISDLDTKSITVTEVRMSPDLKTAKIFVIPLGGKDTEKVIEKLDSFSTSEIDDDVLLTVLKTQDLTKEIFSDGLND